MEARLDAVRRRGLPFEVPSPVAFFASRVRVIRVAAARWREGLGRCGFVVVRFEPARAHAECCASR
eukprot:2513893-Pleurochrysis_carterae.AAC.1